MTGSGQSLALVEFTTYTPSDVATYKSRCGLSVPVSNIYLGGFSSGTSITCILGTSCPECEVALDIELAMSMAPGLNEVMVYMEGSTSDDVLNRIATENTCKQISSSWSWFVSSSDRSTQDNILAEFAAQGQSYFNASGDGNGSTGVGAFTSDPPTVIYLMGTRMRSIKPWSARPS